MEPRPPRPRNGTAQSRAVRDAVGALDHPTADEVFRVVRRRLPRVSLATVYRNLERMVQAGEIGVREVGGQRRYDPNLHAHIHLHDTRTDRLVDIPLTPRLDQALAEIARQHLESLDETLIELKGRIRT